MIVKSILDEQTHLRFFREWDSNSNEKLLVLTATFILALGHSTNQALTEFTTAHVEACGGYHCPFNS